MPAIAHSALAALFALVPAQLAAAPFSCVAQTTGTPSLRLGGYYEMTGDVLIYCQGGTPVAGPQPVYQLKLQLDSRAQGISSRLLDAPNRITEAFAVIDEPPANTSRVVCNTPANVASCPTANYFPGILTGPNELTWNIPLAAGGDLVARQIRIVNIRANLSAFPDNLSGEDFFLKAAVTLSGQGAPPVTMVPSTYLLMGSPNRAVQASLRKLGWGACGAAFLPPAEPFAIQVEESRYPSVFLTRTSGTSASTSPPPTAQDFLGVVYQTESGHYTLGFQGIYQTAGLADFGTRIFVRISNVPAGVKLSTPDFIPLKSSQVPVGQPAVTGIARRIVTDATGAGAYSAAPVTGSGGLVEMAPQGGSLVAVYEILQTDTTSFELLEIPVTAEYVNNRYVPLVGLTYEASLAPLRTAATLQRFNEPTVAPAPIPHSDCQTSNTSIVPAPPSTAGLYFVPVKPCRLVDTRETIAGGFGKPAMVGGQPRSFTLPAAAGCGLPATAKAYSLNFTVVPKSPLGYISVWPTGGQQPFVSTLNSIDGRIKANAAIVPAGTNGAISVMATEETELIVDANGYFVDAASNPQALAFYPLPPCRIADTRNSNGPLGGPVIAAGGTRSFPVIAAASCGVPGGALAYSLNATVVPKGPLGYLTLWPAGENQPFVSTLNSPKGEIVANAAIVPAGTNGTVQAFAQGETHLVLDINGYFAPPGAAGALRFFTVTPCRLLDTRSSLPGLFSPTNVARTANLFPTAANCGLGAAAAAYSLNATVPVTPGTSLGYLTLWPTAQTQPFVSTLNAVTDKVVANAAIVPGGFRGGIDAYATDYVQLVLDVNGFFAP